MKQTGSPTSYERAMLRRRGLNPDDYIVLKRLNYVITLKHRTLGTVKYLDKRS